MSEQKDTTTSRRGISRREFARRAVVASAVAAVAPGALPGGVDSAAAEEKSPLQKAGAAKAGIAGPSSTATGAVEAGGGAGQAPANAPKLSPEGQAEAEARFQSIISQYGKRFSEEQKADLRRLCYVAQPPLDRLRAYALANGDAPALYLKPLVEREKNPLEGTRKGKTPTAANAKKNPASTTHAH